MSKPNKLSRKEFEKLTLPEKYRLLENQGRYIRNRTYSSFQVSLYYFNEFFVEIWRRIGLKQISWIEVIKDEKLLQRYYDDIDLDDLH